MLERAKRRLGLDQLFVAERDDRIRAHVQLCWLALRLVRVVELHVEQRLGQRYSWYRIRDELERMRLG